MGKASVAAEDEPEWQADGERNSHGSGLARAEPIDLSDYQGPEQPGGQACDHANAERHMCRPVDSLIWSRFGLYFTTGEPTEEPENEPETHPNHQHHTERNDRIAKRGGVVDLTTDHHND
jgi:hypothetical protein